MKRAYPNQPIVGVGAIIIHNGKILLEKRKNDPGKGKWSVPGGLVELGENIEETVLREVKEETNLEVENPQHVDVVTHVSLDKNGKIKYHFVIIDYLVKVKRGTLKAASDAEKLQWVPFDKVEKYNLTKSFRAFFEKNRQRLESRRNT